MAASDALTQLQLWQVQALSLLSELTILSAMMTKELDKDSA